MLDTASQIQRGSLQQASSTGQAVLLRQLKPNSRDFSQLRLLPLMWDDKDFEPLVDQIMELSSNSGLSEQAFIGEAQKAAQAFEEKTKGPNGQGLLTSRYGITPEQIGSTFLNLKLTAGTPENAFKRNAARLLYSSALRYGTNARGREDVSAPGAELLDYMLLHSNGFQLDTMAQYNGSAVNCGTPSSDLSSGSAYAPVRIMRDTKSLAGWPFFVIDNVIMKDPEFKEIQMNVDELKEAVKSFGYNITRRMKGLVRLRAKIETTLIKIMTPEKLVATYDAYLQELSQYKEDGLISEAGFNNQANKREGFSKKSRRKINFMPFWEI
jgi:hypothetical protein